MIIDAPTGGTVERPRHRGSRIVGRATSLSALSLPIGLVALLLLSSCRNREGNPPFPEPDHDVLGIPGSGYMPGNPAREAPGERHRGGQLRVQLLMPRTLDPLTSTYEHESCMINQIFDGLVELDSNLRPNPALASYWEVDPDNLTYTFDLRPDARFHHGRPVTSMDFVYTFERVLHQPPGQGAGQDLLLVLRGARAFMDGTADTVIGIRAPGPLVLVLELEHPVANYPTLLAEHALHVVPGDVIESIGSDAFGRSPVGTGPFRFRSWDKKQIILERNEDYFGGAPALDEVIFDLGQIDLETATDSIERGEIDLLPYAPQNEDNLANQAVLHNWDNNIVYLAFDVTREPLNDPRIRRAIALAIDRSTLATIEGLILEPSRSLIPRGLFGHSLDATAPAYDPDEARRLLAEAGHPDGEGLWPIDLWTALPSGIEDRIRDDLHAVGIGTRMRVTHYSRLEKAKDEGRVSMWILPFSFHLADGPHMLRRLFHSEGTYNTFHYVNPELDHMMETGEQLLDSLKRFEMFEKAQKMILADLPVAPLLMSRSTFAVRRTVRGLSPGPFGLGSLRLEEVWLSEP
jgi:ABC-type transport system substrate-binding protein